MPAVTGFSLLALTETITSSLTSTSRKQASGQSRVHMVFMRVSVGPPYLVTPSVK